MAARAADSWGVLSVGELHACGLTESGIARRVEAGWLHRIHRGVFAVGHTGLTQEGRWLAAVKACGPDALLAGFSSLMLFDVQRADDRRIEVLVPEARRRTPKGIVVRCTRGLHREDVQRHRGVPTCSAARAIFDVASRSTDKDVRRLMSRAQSTYHTNLRLLARQLDRANGKPSARYARILAAGPPRTRSELEDRVFDLIEASDLPRPDVNVPLRLDGRTVIPDFRWPDRRLVVEADGAQWHDNPQQQQEDAERQRLLEAHGERVERIDWQQATQGARQTLAHIERVWRSPHPGCL